MINYIKRHLNRNFLILFLYDILSINISLLLSLVIRYDSLSPVIFENHISFSLIAVINLIKILSFKYSSLYRGMWRYTSIWDVYNIIKANVFSTFIIMLYIYFSLGFGAISRTLFIVDLLVCTALIGTSRVGIRIFLERFIV